MTLNTSDTRRRPDETRALDPRSPKAARAALQHLVDATDRLLRRDDIETMDDFVLGLDTIRRSVPADDWQTLISDVIAPHPIRGRLHEEPLTRRAFDKPRGYPGDAALIDLVYRHHPVAEALTPLGARLHAWVDLQASGQSVRERRRILAALIDRVAAERSNPRIMSVACGHLREAQDSDALRQGGVEEIVALDQDPESLAVIDREQRAFNVTPVRKSVRRFLIDPSRHGTFDLVYAAGLYDYLPDDVANALTRAMFDILRPGGMLLVANFAPELRDIGYLDAIMDWRLIYRDEASVARFAAGIPASAIAERSITRDRLGNVIYLSVRKG